MYYGPTLLLYYRRAGVHRREDVRIRSVTTYNVILNVVFRYASVSPLRNAREYITTTGAEVENYIPAIPIRVSRLLHVPSRAFPSR